ncbi:MAG TPA: acetoin utilization protein AcuC [Rubrobacteraceae bacterium]|nr:acetoin utilization protein AcuC [Rubrobacteraceae bacterium]
MPATACYGRPGNPRDGDCLLSGKSAIVHDRRLESYGFGDDHPFNPLRIRMTLELCESLGLFDGYEFVGSEPASDEDLRTVHSLTYIRSVQQAGRGLADLADLISYGIGTPDNPIVPDIHEAGADVCGAVLKAARMVISGEVDHALCISGGLHHALRSQASGFCFYNDAGVAIARLKQEHPGIRVAYLDTDAHHGDGVQWMFYDDPEVLTISMHESGRYLFPGTGGVEERGRNGGVGYSVNVPLEPFTDDSSWISCFEAVVPEALRTFGPDLILSQNGCDGHKLDPLTHLSATTRLYEHVPRRVHELAHELCEGRWVATGGGGYDIWRVVPRAWTILWATLSHQRIPEKVSGEWLDKWGARSPVRLPTLMRDDPADYPEISRAEEIAERNSRTVAHVLESVLARIKA